MLTFKEFVRAELTESSIAQMLEEQEIYATDAQRLDLESKKVARAEKQRAKDISNMKRDALFRRKINHARQLANDIKSMQKIRDIIVSDVVSDSADSEKNQ